MSSNRWGVDKKLMSRKSQIDIKHQGYYYKCRNCGAILSSMNESCGCDDPFMQVMDA